MKIRKSVSCVRKLENLENLELVRLIFRSVDKRINKID